MEKLGYIQKTGSKYTLHSDVPRLGLAALNEHSLRSTILKRQMRSVPSSNNAQGMNGGIPDRLRGKLRR